MCNDSICLVQSFWFSHFIRPGYQIDIVTYFISSGLGFSTYSEVQILLSVSFQRYSSE